MHVPVLPRPVRYAGAVVVAAVLLYASVRRPAQGGGGPPSLLLGVPADKWLHLLAYAGFAGVVAYARLAGREEYLAVVVVVVAYGLVIEGIQAPIPYRAFSVADAAVNALGAVVGVAVWSRLRPVLSR